MKVTSFLKFSVLAAGMVAAMGANAADGTITVAGSTVASGCIINYYDKAATITLGNMTPSTFTTVGSSSEKKDITIKLTDCPSTLTGVKFTAIGAADKDNNQIIALSAGSTASGLGIALYNKSGALIPVNSPSAAATIAADGTAKIELQAAAMSTSAQVASGDFSATTEFNLTYN